jgi:hypothetical protein
MDWVWPNLLPQGQTFDLPGTFAVDPDGLLRDAGPLSQSKLSHFARELVFVLIFLVLLNFVGILLFSLVAIRVRESCDRG